MIKYVRGNILYSHCNLLCNTVNCKGVMGAGLAKQFKARCPEMFEQYKINCENNIITPGCVWIYWGNDPTNLPWIANLAVKDHWKDPSQLCWVEKCLENLRDLVLFHHIPSLAIPPLGCGLGGLNWADVKPMIEREFNDLPEITVEIYEPL